jgi:chemotaxis response regulator CheB
MFVALFLFAELEPCNVSADFKKLLQQTQLKAPTDAIVNNNKGDNLWNRLLVLQGDVPTVMPASEKNPNRSDCLMQAKSIAKDFPVVCVGGSAGGLDAYTRLLQQLPIDLGVAIVIVNHLRTVATLLHEILPFYTKMPVELITEKLVTGLHQKHTATSWSENTL